MLIIIKEVKYTQLMQSYHFVPLMRASFSCGHGLSSIIGQIYNLMGLPPPLLFRIWMAAP